MSGQSEEFRVRLVELLPRLRRFALSLTGNQNEADDLVQDACERALRHADTFQQGRRLESWVFGIMQNAWYDRLRANRVRGRLAGDRDGIENIADYKSNPEQNVELRQVVAAMGELNDDQRVVMALVCLEGFSYSEAAQILDWPIGTVMSRLNRGRKALAACLEASDSLERRCDTLRQAPVSVRQGAAS